MGSDLLALSALAKELNDSISGARIDKIVQPESDEVRFFLRSGGKNLCLVASCNSQVPRLHLTEVKKQNPVNAPSFCMLLRKYLSSATIQSVKIHNEDRIIAVKFRGRTEMKDEADFYLYVEIMSRYSNMIFADGNGIILNAIKRLPLSESNDHVVMHGLQYSPLKQAKTSYLTASFDFLKAFSGGDLHQYILDNVSGFSGITVSELIARAGLMDTMPPLHEDEIFRIVELVDKCKNINSDNMYAPCVVSGKDVIPFEYCIFKGKCQKYPTMNAAFDALCSTIDGDLRRKARLKNLVSAAKRYRIRVEKRIADDKIKLADCENMNVNRVYGDMIINNIYLVKKGDTLLKCRDYVGDGEYSIPLDATLSPSGNAKAYYSKYNKLKRTKDFLDKKIKDDINTLDYVKSIEEELEVISDESPTAAIEAELSALGAIYVKKVEKSKVRKEKPEPPVCYNIDGFAVYCGRNNIQNDELTFKVASNNDIWMHLKNAHGMHTIIITDGKQVPDKVLKIAAEITASTKTNKIEVDYTERINVRRIPGGHPGLVNYVDYKTINALPDAHEGLRVK